MKVAIIIPDGCADEPQAALDGKTPLQAARVPGMDEVAALGRVGLSCNTPVSLPAGLQDAKNTASIPAIRVIRFIIDV